MGLVHDHGAEPALPEMAGALAPRMDDAGITAVHGGKRPEKAIGIRRHQDEVDVVGHQAPGPHVDIGGAAMLGEEVAVERIVGVEKEGARARPSPL